MESLLEISEPTSKDDLLQYASSTVTGLKLRKNFLLGAELTDTTLIQCELSRPNFLNARVMGNHWLEMTLFEANLADTIFSRTYFKKVEFKDVLVRKATFDHCVFEDLTFDVCSSMEESMELTFSGCTFLKGSSLLQALFLNRQVAFTNCTFLEGNLPERIQNDPSHTLVSFRPAEAPKKAPVASQPSVPHAPASVPQAAATASAIPKTETGNPSRFDKLEL